MTKIGFALTLIFLISLGQGASASSLTEIYQDARENDPDLKIAKSTQQIAVAEKNFSRSALMPSANLEVLASSNTRDFGGLGATIGLDDSFNDTSLFATLRQPIVDLEARRNLKGASSALQAADWALMAAEQDLILRTISAYFDVLVADALLTSTRAEEDAVEEQLKEVERKFDAGIIAVTDVLEAQAIFDETTVRRLQVASSKENAFEALRALTSFSYAKLFPVSNDLPIDNPNPKNERDWIAIALDNNPVVKQAQSNLESAAFEASASRAKRYPKLFALAQYQHQDEVTEYLIDGTSLSETLYGLSVRWDLYSGGQTAAAIARSNSQLAVAQAQLEKTQLNVDKEVRTFYREVINAVKQVGAGQSATKSAATALTAIKAGYEAGSREILDLLLAQQRLNQAEYQLTSARQYYVTKMVLLKAATGALTEEDLRQVSAYTDANRAVWRDGDGSDERGKQMSDWRLNSLQN